MLGLFRRRSVPVEPATGSEGVAATDPGLFLRTTGRCPICERDTAFEARDPGLRDFLLCTGCGSLPRERALMHVIDLVMPGWRDAVIHESSPAPRGASLKLATQCRGYIKSQYLPDRARRGPDDRHEDLEALTFDEDSVDLHVTQDVMEHIFRPSCAFREFARTLKAGGMHVFTVPLVRQHQPTVIRARRIGDEVDYLLEAEYHGNPVGDGRSLVTVDWGYDICDHIARVTGLHTTVFRYENPAMGILGYYTDVLVTRKPAVDTLALELP